MHMLPFTKIHLVELAIEIFSTNQEITTAAVSSLRTGTSVVLFHDKGVPNPGKGSETLHGL